MDKIRPHKVVVKLHPPAVGAPSARESSVGGLEILAPDDFNESGLAEHSQGLLVDAAEDDATARFFMRSTTLYKAYIPVASMAASN